MEWPTSEEQWPDGYQDACMAYAEVAKVVAGFEPVTMIARPGLAGEAAVLCGPAVDILPMEHDDSWIRDNGPTFVVNQSGLVAGINWKFNAWGEKFSPWEGDNLVAPRLLNHLELPRFDAPIVMEGGSIHVDGEGTLLTTELCLLNKNRNPRLGRKEIEDVLKQHLGVKKIIWLKQGLEGDETDGHVDNVACFAKPGLVLVQNCQDPSDPNYDIMEENIAILQDSTDARGRKLTIMEFQQPSPVYVNGARLPLSYINFYFVNGGIVLPSFGGSSSSTDEHAAAVLRNIFADREVVNIDVMPIIKGGGSVHCITQQMPLGILEENRRVQYA
jgi:agmatine deiminase